MKVFQYKCTLLSDLVISSSSATEGFHQSLDYIPGAKFLGLVAGRLYNELYKTEPTKVLDLFHNGKVRFSDAHPCIDGEMGLRVPFKWFYKKGGSITEEIYLHTELLSQEVLAKNQPKQARVGYFTTSGKYLKTYQDFSIKSAYDSEELRAKESQMYGYFALKKNTEWIFTIEDTTGTYAEMIKDIVVGKKRVGRSRSAQYGLVDITFLGEVGKEDRTLSTENIVYLYAKSNLCFYDSYGRNTAKPSPSQLGLPTNSAILWEKSQVRTRLYQTWNQKRFNRDADRVIIEKGSVFAVDLSKATGIVNSSEVESGVGAHQSEGFGKILIHPSFLQSDTAELNFPLEKVEEKDWKSKGDNFVVKNGKQDSIVLAYLKSQKEATQKVFDIDKMVNDFIKDNKDFAKISNSQWGMVRNFAKYSFDNQTFKELVFSKEVGCLHRGQSEKEWRRNARRDTLYQFLFETSKMPASNILPFTIKLAAQMAKSKSEK